MTMIKTLKMILVILCHILLFLSCKILNYEELSVIEIPPGYKVMDGAFQKTETGEVGLSILFQSVSDESQYLLYPQKKVIYINMEGHFFGENAGSFYCWGDYGAQRDCLMDGEGHVISSDVDFCISKTGQNYYYSVYHGQKYYKYFWNDEFITYGATMVAGVFRKNEESLVLAVRDREDQYRIRLLEFYRNDKIPRVIGAFLLPQEEDPDPNVITPYHKNSLLFHILEDDTFLLEYKYIIDGTSYWGVREESSFTEEESVLDDFAEATDSHRKNSLFFCDDILYRYGNEIVKYGTMMDFYFSPQQQEVIFARMDNEETHYIDEQFIYTADLVIQTWDTQLYKEPYILKEKGKNGRFYYNTTCRTSRLSPSQLWDLGFRVQVGYVGNSPAYGASIPVHSLGGLDSYVEIGNSHWEGYNEFKRIQDEISPPIYALKMTDERYTLIMGDLKSKRSFSEIYDIEKTGVDDLNLLVFERSESGTETGRVSHLLVGKYD